MPAAFPGMPGIGLHKFEESYRNVADSANLLTPNSHVQNEEVPF